MGTPMVGDVGVEMGTPMIGDVEMRTRGPQRLGLLGWGAVDPNVWGCWGGNMGTPMAGDFGME